jgi:hypothetical protein
MAYGLSRMVRAVKLYAISYQPYAKYARLASEILLSRLRTEFFQQPAKSVLHSGVIPAADNLRP